MKPTPNTQEQELESNIIEIDKDCLNSVQGHFPVEEREEFYKFKLSENWHHYLELKAELKGFKQGQEQERKRCLEIIDKFNFDAHILNYDGDLIFLTEGREELKQQIEDTK